MIKLAFLYLRTHKQKKIRIIFENLAGYGFVSCRLTPFTDCA